MRQHCYTMPFGLDMPIAVWEQSIHCICICIIIILTARALPLARTIGDERGLLLRDTSLPCLMILADWSKLLRTR